MITETTQETSTESTAEPFNGLDLSGISFWTDDDGGESAEASAEETNVELAEGESTEASAEDETAEEAAEEAEPAPSEARRRFLAATKKEKELLQREQAVKAAEQKAKVVEALSTLKGRELITALKNAGVDPNDFMGRISEAYTEDLGVELETDPVKKLQAEVEALRKDREQEKEAARLREEQAQHIATAQKHIAAAIEAAADTYPSLTESGNYAPVFRVIEGYFERTGQALSWEDAAALVEKKLSAPKGERSKESVPTSKVRAKSPTRSTKTLTNRANNQAAIRKQDALPEDRDELIAEVAKQFGGQLWNA